MVRGSPRRSTTNGGVERFNRTMEEKIGAWMKDNNSTRWSIGCRIVCWRYNTQTHRALGGVSPYHKTFGQIPRVGISGLKIDSALLSTLHTELELNRALCIPDDSCIEDATIPFNVPSLPTKEETDSYTENLPKSEEHIEDPRRNAEAVEDDGKFSHEEDEANSLEVLRIVEKMDKSCTYLEFEKVRYLIRLKSLVELKKPLDKTIATCETVGLEEDFVRGFLHELHHESSSEHSKVKPDSAINEEEATSEFVPELMCRWIELVEGVAKPPDKEAVASASLGTEFAIMY